ncbi:YopX family protein [Bacillus sp. AR13-1]|uniref:YopX family protein n=1 Tax=Bacillus sp. AR13-1 TaxID=2217833 RepID=UPI00351A2FF7
MGRMREIKFRGKPIEFYSDTKWFYGSAIMNYEDRLAYIEEPGNGFVPVKWASVSEYTGLKDKNDKELFEGDVFEENYFDNEYDGQVINRYEVIFNNGAFMAKPIGVTSNKFPI